MSLTLQKNLIADIPQVDSVLYNVDARRQILKTLSGKHFRLEPGSFNRTTVLILRNLVCPRFCSMTNEISIAPLTRN